MSEINPVIRNLSLAQSNGDIVKIGDNNYRFSVYIMNGDGAMTGIKFAAIADLKIVDDLKLFCTEGYIVFENNDDILESAQFLGRGDTGETQEAFIPYSFRGDGRDYLVVNICPQVEQTGNYEESIPNDNRCLSYKYSIYNYEDITSSNNDIKLKKLFFRDFCFEVLSEKDSYFSTGKYRTGTSNTDRSISTGAAIQQVIDKAFFEDYELPQKFSQDWDYGASNIFYSSIPSYKALDDIKYLLDYHVSGPASDHSPCILRKERGEIWTLIPVTNYFKQAYYRGNASLGDLGGSRLIENFTFPNQTTQDSYNEQPSRNSSVSLMSNDLADYNFIENFQFANMTAIDTQENMVTHVVHNYNPAEKMFTIDLAENNIYKNNDIYDRNFVAGFKGVNGAAKSDLVYNQIRTLHKNIKHHYNPNTDNFQRLNSGRNRALLAGIFLNNTISFRARGNTARTAGKFITISRNDSSIDNSFDNKVMGTYLIVKIEHCFCKGQYFNNLICTKTYTTEQQKVYNTVI